MSYQGVTGSLGTGGQFRLMANLLEITDPRGSVVASFDMNTISSAHRDGSVITLTRYSDTSITINAASEDDARLLEHNVQATVAARQPTPPPPAPPPPVAQQSQPVAPPQPPPVAPVPPVQAESGGRSTGKILLFGGIGCFALIACACIAFVLITVVFSDDGNGPSDNIRPAGETALVDGVEITFLGARRGGPDLFTPDPGNIYVLTEFQIVNATDDEYTVATLVQFIVFDKNDDEYIPTLSPRLINILDGRLQPGEEVIGEVGFELPDDGAPFVVRFQEAFFENESADWNLGNP